MSKVQSGRSMIEMLGVLAIIGVLSAGGLWGYSSAMENYKINKLIEDTAMMISNTIILYDNGQTPQTNGDTNITSNMQSLGMLPDIKNPFGNNYGLRIREYRTGSSCLSAGCAADTELPFYFPAPCKSLLVSIGLVPKNVCAKLMMHDWRNMPYFTVSYISNSGLFFDEPLSAADAEDFCRSESNSNGEVQMHIWAFF